MKDDATHFNFYDEMLLANLIIGDDLSMRGELFFKKEKKNKGFRRTPADLEHFLFLQKK